MFVEQARQLPVRYGEYDIAVAGGGIAGVAAALAAARAGRKVLLIERMFGLGGLATGLTKHESLVVGVGMVARSEVALMVAQKGINAGLIDPVVLPAVVLSVVAAGLSTPILLKGVISRSPELS